MTALYVIATIAAFIVTGLLYYRFSRKQRTDGETTFAAIPTEDDPTEDDYAVQLILQLIEDSTQIEGYGGATFYLYGDWIGCYCISWIISDKNLEFKTNNNHKTYFHRNIIPRIKKPLFNKMKQLTLQDLTKTNS